MGATGEHEFVLDTSAVLVVEPVLGVWDCAAAGCDPAGEGVADADAGGERTGGECGTGARAEGGKWDG